MTWHCPNLPGILLGCQEGEKMRRLLLICLCALMVACSSKPSDHDVRAALEENFPAEIKGLATIDQLQWEQSSSADESSVKFKSSLKTAEVLFVEVPFAEAAAGAGASWDLADQVDALAHQLRPETQEKFKDEVQAAIAKPVFLKVATAAGTSSDWYGSFKAKKVVDKWVVSDFKTEVEPKISGRPRSAFPPGSVDVANAKSWLAEASTKQEALRQRINDAMALEAKDAELTRQVAATQQERQAKEALLAAQERQLRRLPVQVSFQRALVGNSLVMQLDALRAMTLHLEVARDLQQFTRDVQLMPGHPTRLGHIEGWGFRHGDVVKLTNPSFDPITFRVP